jgi:hypothetical protein
MVTLGFSLPLSLCSPVACSVPLRPDADIGLVQEGELDSQWSAVPGLHRLFLKPAWSAKPVGQKKAWPNAVIVRKEGRGSLLLVECV